MTQQEFFERTGIECSGDEYETVERIYMAAGGMDKDNFCKAYKSLTRDGRMLAAWLMSEAETKEKQVKSLSAEVEMKEREQRELAEYLIDKAYVHDDIEMYRMAVNMVGSREVILLTLKMGRHLREDDIKYIAENLK